MKIELKEYIISPISVNALSDEIVKNSTNTPITLDFVNVKSCVCALFWRIIALEKIGYKIEVINISDFYGELRQQVIDKSLS